MKQGNRNGVPAKSAKRSTPSLGPVSNLEAHVPDDWWRRIFNATYLKTDGDVVGDRQLDRQEVDLFSRLLECKPEESILDLCCGQGRHCLQMARLGFRHLYGYDRSHYLIQKARSQAKKEGLPVTFKEGDARKLSFADQSFEVVMLLGNSFGYFDSAQQDVRVLKEVARVLKPDGRILLDLTDGDYMRTHFKPRSWEWLDQYHFVCRERALSADEQRLICREILTHTTKGVLVDQFYAERLYSPESITLLLQEAGFAQVVLQGNLQTGSQRNQDVGMMERRLIATAVANKEPLSSQLKDEAYYREPARMSNTW